MGRCNCSTAVCVVNNFWQCKTLGCKNGPSDMLATLVRKRAMPTHGIYTTRWSAGGQGARRDIIRGGPLGLLVSEGFKDYDQAIWPCALSIKGVDGDGLTLKFRHTSDEGRKVYSIFAIDYLRVTIDAYDWSPRDGAYIINPNP